MSVRILSEKVFVPVAPEKGSFPLDHEGICKRSMLQYMVCLADNKRDNSKCRQESKEYLECRMNNVLMTKEDLSNLGFSDTTNEVNAVNNEIK